MRNTVIIGGGPAGLMAAISSSKNGDKVTIIEKMHSCGKKLLITGKGRCNITNNAQMYKFMENTPTNPKFLYGVFNNFTNKDIIELLKSEGVKTKVERGERVFPVSNRAQDVLEALLHILKKQNVQILTNSMAKRITTDEEKNVLGVELDSGKEIKAEKIILATGGRSYPVTGSTGDGYKLAKDLGHTITKIEPSLVPLTSHDEVCKELQGLSLRNVAIQLRICDKVVYKDFGEMLFTHFGVSGPIVLSASSYLVKTKNIEQILKEGKVELEIDLKPALSEEKLDARILRDFEGQKNKQFKNSLDKLLPQKLIPVIIEKTHINENKKINEITKQERQKLETELKHFKISINGTRSIEEAIVTSGGINVKEINPKTMESKLINGLYFAGEIIDVDCLTGGYNLQVAWSTGYTAGIS